MLLRYMTHDAAVLRWPNLGDFLVLPEMFADLAFCNAQTSLASRLGQFCVCSQSSAARKLKNLRTGVSSGLTVLQPLATLVSDGRITVALTGDVRIDTDRDDVSDAREARMVSAGPHAGRITFLSCLRLSLRAPPR